MVLVAIAVAYLAGSVPFGLLLGFCAGKDVRREGSGNIGATNVLRVCGPKLGILALLLDFLKGFSPLFWGAPLVGADRPWMLVALGLAAILGHNFPVWLRFKGGKGVATSAGVVAALMPAALGVAVGTWIVVVAASRYVSLGSICAAVALFAAQTAFGGDPVFTVLAAALAVLVILRHRANIRRLRDGTENKIFAKKKPVTDEAAKDTTPPPTDPESATVPNSEGDDTAHG